MESGLPVSPEVWEQMLRSRTDKARTKPFEITSGDTPFKDYATPVVSRDSGMQLNYIPAQAAIDRQAAEKGWIIDVRGQEAYNAGHYSTALHAKSQEELSILPQETELYLYCT